MAAFPIKVGILGGGQLARMLALSAASLGARPFVFIDKPQDCAASVCADAVLNDGTDTGLRKFIELVDVVTFENEFVDLARLERALGDRKVYPGLPALRLAQNKLQQKINLGKNKIPTLDFLEVSSEDQLRLALEKFSEGLVLKSASHGYDGKGTFIFKKGKLRSEEFWRQNPGFKGYAEPLAPFKKELAVVVARSVSGEVQAFPTVETHQEDGICQWTIAPASVPAAASKKAQKIADQIIRKFQGIGVFGVEMFLLQDGQVVVNEIAPRVHNSGHWTMNGAKVSQFEQHLRAILDMPLLKTDLLFPAVAMVNILGRQDGSLEAGDDLESSNSGKRFLQGNTWIHWYGKSGAILRRKLGHINAGDKNAKAALAAAVKVRKRLLI